MNLFERGAKMLADSIDTLGVSVVYRRAAEALTLNAKVGSTAYEVDSVSGTIQRYESRDYIVRAADLDFAAGVSLPAKGDQIEEVIGGVTQIYQVMPAGGSEPVFSYHDLQRTMLRIHTKHTGPA